MYSYQLSRYPLQTHLQVPHIPSLGAMFGTIGSKDLALSNQSVDWEQLLRVGGGLGG